MHPLFEPTRMLRAEKGDHQQCFGSLSRWVHHESPRARRPQRAAAPHRAHARAKARVHRRRRHHREARAGQSPDRRHRIRLGRHSKSAPRPRNQGGHPCEPDTKEQAATRSQALRVPVSCRDVLPQFEALSRHCDAFREDCQELPLATSAHERQAVARRLAAGAGGRNLGQPLVLDDAANWALLRTTALPRRARSGIRRRTPLSGLTRQAAWCLPVKAQIMASEPRYVARAEAGVGWRVWDRKLERWWGNFFADHPAEILQELNGQARPEAFTALARPSESREARARSR